MRKAIGPRMGAMLRIQPYIARENRSNCAIATAVWVATGTEIDRISGAVKGRGFGGEVMISLLSV
jgi:hypothetical protein